MKTQQKIWKKLLISLLAFVFIFESSGPSASFATEKINAWFKRKPVVLTEVKTDFHEGKSVIDSVVDAITDSKVVKSVQNFLKSDQEIADEIQAEQVLPKRNPVPKGKIPPKPTRVKEIVEKRNATTTIYQLSDGTMEANISSAPVHYQDEKGKWQRINNNVVSTKKEKGYSFGNEANQMKTYFGNKNDELVKFNDGKHQLVLGVGTTSTTSFNPKTEKDEVIYQNIFPDSHLKYNVNNQAVKESLILQSPPKTNVFDFHFKLHGVRAKKEKDGSIIFTSIKEDRPVFTIPKPFMFDNKKQADSPVGYTWSDKVVQEVIQHGSNITVRVSANNNWLQDAKRVYPITIDPTIIIQPPPSGAQASQDVMINNYAPTTNFDGSWKLNAGADSAQSIRSLLKFDLSTIPQGVQINYAQLNLYYDQTFCVNCTTTDNVVNFSVHRLLQDWDAKTATWNQAKTGVPWTSANKGGTYNASFETTTNIVDDTNPSSAYPNGTWSASSSVAGAYGDSYQVSAASTTGADTFTWQPYFNESGDYKVEIFNVPASDRATNTPLTITHADGTTVKTVDQKNSAKGWVDLGTYRFKTGDTGKIVMNDKANGYVVADAIRFTKQGIATRHTQENNAWHDFTMQDLVQDWIDGKQSNYGVLVKAKDETLKVGGVRYEASEIGEEAIRPTLKVVYGMTAVDLQSPTKIHANGAELKWSKYRGSDFTEYQIHRSSLQSFKPDDTTLVAPIADPNTLAFTDTTAVPTPSYSADLFGKSYYYMVVVKNTKGELIPGRAQFVQLPKSGYTKQILQNANDTTISSAVPSTNLNSLDGEAWNSAGNNSGTYANTRSLFKFDISSIPAKSYIADAKFGLWTWYQDNTGTAAATYNLHTLNKAFTETTATWNSNATGFNSTAVGSITNVNNDPQWRSWNLKSTVQSWVNGATTNYGLMVKHANEASTTQLERVLFISSELATAPQLKPKLEITYVDKKAANSYYAPKSPVKMTVGTTYDVDVTLTNATTQTWNGTTDYLSYHWVLPDGTDKTNASNQMTTQFKPLDANGNEASTPVSVAPGQTITVKAKVKAPDLSILGAIRQGYMLQWDLNLGGTWLSKQTTDPIPTLNQYITVEDPNGGKDLGLEEHTSVLSEGTGADGAGGVSLFRGNALFSYSAFDNPSLGDLNTTVDFTYNSLDTADSILGVGWSLSTSSLMRLGSPLGDGVQVDASDKVVSGDVYLLDDDGTTHSFTYNPASKQFIEPPGSGMYLQYISGGTKDKKWVITEPDRTQYYFDEKGYITQQVDNAGDALKYVYEEKSINNEPAKLLKYIVDSSGRKTLTLDYNADGRVQQITDVADRVMYFTYDAEGRLSKFTDGYGKPEAKTYEFTYDLLYKSIINKIKDPRGKETVYTYYTSGNNQMKVNTISNRKSETVTYTYNGSEKIATDLKGNQTKYVMDTNGNPTSITDAKGNTSKYTYDSAHRITKQEDPNGAITTWTYDSNGLMLTETDAVNNAIADPEQRKSTIYEYQYSLGGKVADLIKKTSPAGRYIKYTYDAQGNLLTTEDAKGNKVTYTYHGTTGLVKTVTDANGNVTTYGDATSSDYGYAPTGQAKVITNAKGEKTTTSYGERGEILTVTDANGNTSTFTYDVFERALTSKIPKDVSKNEYITVPAPVYDGDDNVIEKTLPNGAKITYTYDDNDNVLSVTNPKNNSTDPDSITTYQYDQVGNLIKETEPKGNLTPNDPNDYTTTYSYNELNQLVAVKNSKGEEITYEYDQLGNQVKATQPKGNLTPDNPDDYTIKTEYDKNDRPIKVIDADGKTAESTYDPDGNVITTKDKDGRIYTTIYNELGQVIETQEPYGDNQMRVTRFTYDKNGNQLTIESPLGVTTATVDDYVKKNVYDELNRVKEVILPNDPTSQNPRFSAVDKMIYSYDKMGNVASVSMPASEGQTNRLVTTFDYFDNGANKSVTDPWGIKTTYTYDDMGNETNRTIMGSDGTVSRTMNWAFYLDGKLKTMSDEGLQATSSNADSIRKQFDYLYDVNGNLVTMKDASTGAAIDTYQTTYTELNQVAQLDEIQGGQVKKTSKFTYDVHGNPLHQEYTGGLTDLEYNNPLDQVTKMTVKTSETDPKPQVYTYQYQPTGKLSQKTMPNGNTINYSYYLDDALKQMETKKADGNSIQKHLLEYNENGSQIKDTYTGIDADNKPINNTFTYQYDPRDRLISYNKAGDNPVTESYVLDANSNIVSKTQNGQVTSYQYDKNRLTAVSKGGETSLYSYDAMGRVEKVTKNNKVDEQFTFDQFDRTTDHTKLNKDGVTTTTTKYTFDPMDRTISKIENAGTAQTKTTTFNYLGQTNQVISEEVAGQLTKSYTYSPWGERLSMMKQNTGEHSYYQYNTDVDVEMLTDENGSVKATYGY
ncbi:DNRLRE domain-containing protein, partial [Shimazuella kribbensis]|uniref:DNRLRE domain-containing protein n=1 Tax=Shimazuella kribbensis TaxID=139808 RepID=UPI00048CBFD1